MQLSASFARLQPAKSPQLHLRTIWEFRSFAAADEQQYLKSPRRWVQSVKGVVLKTQ
jgi:hypothetical protein